MSGEKLKILVVDDSPTMRQLLKMFLTQHLNCLVEEAPDGLQASKMITTKVYDLVVTDINMPVMDGLKLVAMVRSELKLPVPIIIVTTRGAEKERDEGLALGANAYITKPMDSLALIKKVRELLSPPAAP
jgi:two-component system chemotaxis response regulator CheY